MSAPTSSTSTRPSPSFSGSRSDLPGQDTIAAKTAPVTPAFDRERHADAQNESRGSTMVANDRPHPAPHPSPGLAQDVDRAAFNAAWDRECRDAEDRNREARREDFKAARSQEPDTSRSRTFNRTVTR